MSNFSLPIPDTSNLRSKPVDLFFPLKIKAHICIPCVEGFRDEASQKEYLISGICQKCQDGVPG